MTLIALLIFVVVLIVIGLAVTRYDEEVRALLGRMERIRADNRGFESSFGSAGTTTKDSPGGPGAPESEPREGEIPTKASETEDLDLKAETDTDVLGRAMINAVFDDEDARAQEIRTRIHEVASDPVDAAIADAWFDAVTFERDGDPNVLARLRERAKDSRITATVESLVGLVLANVQRSSEAAEAYNRAFETAANPGARADALASRSQLLTKTGQAEKGRNELKSALADESDAASRSTLWKALAKTYQADERYFEEALALQEARKHEPSDADLCFEIGWALSQTKRKDLRPLAIHFYRLAIYLDPKRGYALNNLGWEYGKAGLPVEAVNNYEKAADLGNSLAMANLAGIKLRAGFADEAEQLLKRGQEQDDIDDNVARTTANAAQARSEQHEKAEALDKEGRLLAEFCSQLTAAESAQPLASLSQNAWWKDGTAVSVVFSNGVLECYWSADEKKRKIEAKLQGRGGVGNRFEMGSWYSIMAGEDQETSWEKKESVLLIVSEDLQEIRLAILNSEGADFGTIKLDAIPDN